MNYLPSVPDPSSLDEQAYALQRHTDVAHRQAEQSAAYAADLRYRLDEIKTALKDAVANDPRFTNDSKRTAEVARRLQADYRDLVDDETTAGRTARADWAELERSQQALKTTLVRLRHQTALIELDAARVGLEAAQTTMPRLNVRTR